MQKRANHTPNKRTIQVGKDLQQFLVQHPAQKKLIHEVRLGGSGLYPAGYQKPPWLNNLSGHLLQCLTLFMVKIFVPVFSLNIWNLLFQFMPIASCPPAMHHSEEPGSTSWVNILLGFGRLLLGALEALSSSEHLLVPLASQAKHPRPQPPWWSSAELAPVYPCLSCIGGTKTGCNTLDMV